MSLRGRHVRTAIAATCRYLVLTVGSVRFALHADHIQGLLTAEEAGEGETLLIQGSSYQKMDLGRRLQLAVDPDGPEKRIVLVSKGHIRAHLVAAQVHGLQEILQSEVLPLPRHFHGDEQGWYEGMILFDAGVALVLNPAWVLEGCEAAAAVPSRADQALPDVHLSAPVAVGGQA
jgi:hypothetical protein